MSECQAVTTVTAAMAAAGAKIIADRFDSLGDDVDELLATRVFQAMRRLEPPQSWQEEARKQMTRFYRP